MNISAINNTMNSRGVQNTQRKPQATQSPQRAEVTDLSAMPSYKPVSFGGNLVNLKKTILNQFIGVLEERDDGFVHILDEKLLKEQPHKLAKLLKTVSNAEFRFNLKEANLSRADLKGAKLIGADLNKANLSRADLRDADLRRADLGEANLRRADLEWADLGEANLYKANLFDAHLRDTNLRWAKALDRDQIKNAKEQEARLS